MSLSLVNALLLILLLGFAWMMYRFNRNNKNYNVVDILTDPLGRASLTNHILAAFAALSIWVVVDREMDGKDDVSTILLGVLAVFVTKQAATQITDIINKPTEPISTTTTTTTEHKEETTVPPTNPLKKGKR